VEKRAMRASQLPTARQSEIPTRAATAAVAGPRAAGPIVLDRYRLVTRLGAGAFGTVWQARDERLDRDVAVKILPRERIVGGRFEREAKAAARLSHPGIVTLYEAAVDDDGAYLVSELVRGGTLAELLESGQLSDHDIVAIGIALCEALNHAHSHGVVHRDVKPSNVLVPEPAGSPAQLAKLTDFGVARVVGGDSLTRTGDVVGTMAYMAPEQAEGREAGAPADLYSTALVIYEALTGVNPVLTGTVAVRARRLGAYLPPLRRQRRDLPRELGQGIDMALRPRARERGTLTELGQALGLSLGLVGERAGVVAGPWPAYVQPREADRPHLPPEPGPRRGWRQAIGGRWAGRALGAAAAAALAAWAAGHLLAPAPLAPSAFAMLAALAVAAFPRLGWLIVVLTAGGIATAQGRSGLGLVIAFSGLVPAVLLPRSAARWPLPAVCPALGVIALAGGWPALAGRSRTTWQRAGLGAAGWVWLIAAGALSGRALYLRQLPGVATSGWKSSPGAAFHHLLMPLLSDGVLVPAVIWALAAAVVPWARARRRMPALNVVVVFVWAAAVAAATGIAVDTATGGHGLILPGEGVLGALAGGFGALVPEISADWRGRQDSADADPELA
jgi:eukaryotic-like serine/threonine-protein kinase